uniref:Uncharacterized protein n=1 Tax=Caenorhabditis japonica TaxID=281687 RepID=A0A8R1DKA3_CAEJA
MRVRDERPREVEKVFNRYSAYIETRRNYLEQSESEEDVEIRTILRRPPPAQPRQSYFRRTGQTSCTPFGRVLIFMVSNLTSVFRSRNQADKKSKGSKKVSTSSEDEQPTLAAPPPPPATMVLIPTITKEDAPKEVEIPTELEQTPSSSVVQEIKVEEPKEEVNGKSVEEVTVEPECSICTKVQDFVWPIYENVKTKYEQTVDRLLDPALHASIRSEFLEYAPSVILGFAIFLFCITFVSILKLLRNGPQTEPSFFCKYFSAPFAPLFDALCEPEPFVFADELPRVMGGLVDEILLTLSEFYRTIGKGFTVFGTLFTAISNGLSQNVSY